MDRKLLFFDIDGTLLAGGADGYIPESTLQALRQAQKNGHLLFINSGRTCEFMPDRIRAFPFDGFLGGCGTEIIFHGASLYHNKLPQEHIDRLMSAFRQTGLQGLLEGQKASFYDDSRELFEPLEHLLSLFRQKDTSYPLLPCSHPDFEFDKFCALCDDSGDLDKFLELTQDMFDYIPREKIGNCHFAEFIPVGHSKATAIDYIVDYLGASLEDTYSFGDSTNDLSMLCHTAHSIAMGNSYPEVFPHVDYVTTPIDRDGIALAMKYYRLI